MRRLKSNRLLSFCLLIALFFPGTATAKTVVMPLTIDYPLLTTIVIRTAFTAPEQTIVLMDEAHGCWEITISEPVYREKEGLLHFRSRLRIHAGVYLLNRCILPIDWEGFLVLVQRPRISQNWMLSFETIDSALYDLQLTSATLANTVWQLVKTSVHDRLSGITINLAPPVTEVKSFLRPMFPADPQDRATRLINSMRPGQAVASPKSMTIDILADVEEASLSKKEPDIETISREELEKSIEAWETWDAFLVSVITSLTSEPLTEEERHILLDVLLQMRHRFIIELEQQTLKGDFVRDQFIVAWQQLFTVFRHHLGGEPSQNILGYLAFFTAFDALAALDKIGPTLGIEMSRNGFIRLLRMISDPTEDSLVYGIEVDRKLREVLGLGPPLTAMVLPLKEDMAPSQFSIALLQRFVQPALAHAASAGPDDIQNIQKWLFQGTGVHGYLRRVKTLFTDVIDATLKKNRLAKAFHQIFFDLIHATAWQESCFRQFVVTNGKATYLRSYNGSSVGMMQINERVWRGVYDRNLLRWDIRYNGLAGCEIANLYIRKYVTRKFRTDQLPETPALAGLIYAMYNGGPAQLHKYLHRRRRSQYFLSDRLFLEKFTWVTQKKWEKGRICLHGG